MSDRCAQATLRKCTAEALRLDVAHMNLNNFIVRPKREYLERYAVPGAWDTLNLEPYAELTEHVGVTFSELRP